jgi:KAP family P-loop domain
MNDDGVSARTPGVVGDNPITTSSEDRLGRLVVAENIARELRTVDASQGYVTGLMGPWGSGKTSMVNLVKEQLQAEPALTVVDFNPWMFSGADALVNSFFREISAQLRLKHSRNFGKLADKLDAYSELLTPLVWLPGVGAWAGRLKTLTGAVKKFKDQSQRSVGEEKRIVSEALEQIDRPIVVVVDDIDRLTYQEIQDLFKLVRLTASFPNIIYLLVFDRKRIEDALSMDGMPGRSYLEKIVQTGIDLPAIPEAVLLRQVGEALQAMVDNVGGVELFDEAGWPDVLVEVIAPLVTSMRDVRRYAASCRLTVESLKEEVELVDILAMEAVRVFLPDVFADLIHASEALTTPSSYHSRDHGSQRLQESIEKLLGEAGSHRPLVEDLIRRLFPAGIRHFANNSYGTDWLNTWLRKRRIAHIDILKLYLERTVSEGLENFSDAERALEYMKDAGRFDDFLGTLARNRLEDVIAALETFEGEYPIEGVVPGITTLLNLMPRIPDRPRGMFMVDTRLIIDRVVLRMLRQLSTQDDIESAVEKILGDLNTLSAKRALILLIGHTEGRGQELVSIEKAEELQSSVALEILAVPNETLLREWDLLRVLATPRQFGLERVRHIDANAPAPVHQAVLSSAKGEIRGMSLGNRHVYRTPTLAWQNLVEVYGSEDEIRRALTKVDASHDPRSEELTALVTKYLEGWRPDED